MRSDKYAGQHFQRRSHRTKPSNKTAAQWMRASRNRGRCPLERMVSTGAERLSPPSAAHAGTAVRAKARTGPLPKEKIQAGLSKPKPENRVPVQRCSKRKKARMPARSTGRQKANQTEHL